MNKLLASLLLLFCVAAVQAQTQATRLYGTAPDYAGQKIQFVVPEDPITGNTEVVTTIHFLPDGSFDTPVLINQTTHCYAEFDRWKAEIYLAPGEAYELEMPPFKPLTEAEKRNPYFQQSDVAFQIKNTQAEDINTRIHRFEQAYSSLENRYFNALFKDKSKAAADSMTQLLQSQFPTTNDTYFERYKFYRLAAIQFAWSQDRTDHFIKTYLDQQPIPYNLPPFQLLFDQQFTNFFRFESNQIDGANFRRLVGTAQLKAVENYLEVEKRWSSALVRLVILKGIHDAFYQGPFHPKTMLALLSQIEKSDWSAKEKQVASAIQQKLTHLMQGTAAPDIALTELNGAIHRLTDFNGKPTYIHFTTITNPICREHLKELSQFAERYQQQFNFVNVLPMADLAKKELILQQNWVGTFVVADEKAFETYQVKTFPTAYLINADGSLLLSPALTPLEGLEKQLNDVLKQQRMERFRNQGK